MAAKIFVGGVTRELEEDALREYFSKYGDVKEVVVLRERTTGNVKGYGFVEFVDSEAAEKAINDEGQHLILNRQVVVKRARSRFAEQRNFQTSCTYSSDQSSNNSNDIVNNVTYSKIFVGGLPSDVTEDEFKSYFEKFGSVKDFVIIHDRETHRPRGFGFITFDLEVAAQNAVQQRFHDLNKKHVEVKIAVPRPNHGTTKSTNNRRISNVSTTRDILNSQISYHPLVCPPCDPNYGYNYSYASPLDPGYGFEPADYIGGYFYEGSNTLDPSYGFEPAGYTRGYFYEGYNTLDPGYGFKPAGYVGGYSYEGFNTIDYSAAYACAGFTWDGLNEMQILVPCCDRTFYPGYVYIESDAHMMVNGGYHGVVWLGNGKVKQTCYLQEIEPASKLTL